MRGQAGLARLLAETRRRRPVCAGGRELVVPAASRAEPKERYVHCCYIFVSAMHSVLSWRLGRAVLAAAFLAMLAPAAGALDLLAPHEVTLQFAHPDGKPMAGAEVRVFAPGRRGQPTLTGHTDSAGKFEFPADEDGFWSAEARSADEISRVMVRVGGGGDGKQAEPLSPFWVIGGLCLLLILAFAYRVARARARRPRP